jgi:methionyl aminopeptidase
MDIELIELKDEKWLQKQTIAGKCVASILKESENLIKNNTPNLSLIDIEQVALNKMKEFGCTPTFLNYHGFPSAICSSVNKQLVHGVVTDYVLKSGDVVSIDLGATFEGAIADAARTWIYGEPKEEKHVRLLKSGKEALEAGMGAVKVGNQLGNIGYAIHSYVKNTEFGSVIDYGGHGISYNMPHADPFVANKQAKNSGIRMVNGLSIAIEPMLVIGSSKTKVGKDGHTIYTDDIGCHFENSVTLFEDKAIIMTDYNSEI